MVHFVFEGSTSWPILVAVAKALGLEPKDLALDVTKYVPELTDSGELLALYAKKDCSIFFTDTADFALSAVSLGKTVGLVTVREDGYSAIKIVSYAPGHKEILFPPPAQIVEIGSREAVEQVEEEQEAGKATG